MRWPRIPIAVTLAIFPLLAPSQLRAQPYARFDVPDSALARTLVAGRTDYENQWNALLVAGLRASLARTDSAARLAALARRVAKAEPQAIGSRIGLHARALRSRGHVAQSGMRVHAAGPAAPATAGRAVPDFASGAPRHPSALGASRS